MANPGTMMVEMELAAVDVWFKAMKLMIENGQRLFALQMSMLPPAVPYHRWHDVPAFLADMMGHYGRRSHDVDVEHLR